MKTLCVAAIIALTAMTAPLCAQTQEEADAKLAAEEWRDAADDYRALLAGDGASAQNWFNLASALHQLEDYEGARDAYLAALEAGYPRAVQAQFRLARIYMSLGQEEAALEQLEEIANTGGPNGQFVRNTAEFESLLENPRFIAVVATLTPCTDEEYRHFDFWLGEWDVTGAGSAQPTAKSKISSKHGGCVVLEEYDVLSGAYTGMSINYYDNVRGVWHQSWMANNGAPVYLEGGLNDDGAMVLSDAEHAISEVSGAINRVTWTPNEDGSVRQFWETSSDGGETWSVAFDGMYTRKAED
ncbi:MAG: tetratricopeptide repeat protein [Pseudomonadota bacterium]